MKLVRRFFSYYKPHKRLFLLDLVCSFTISVCNMFYPMIARNIMNDYVPNQTFGFSSSGPSFWPRFTP